jgi:hypothetical protein
VDEKMKASHLLQYSTRKQEEGESGADFVDDLLRLTKFIQQDTTNSKHKSLAQTIFTTPNMTLSRTTSLFETYHPGTSSSSAPAPSVNALFCRYSARKRVMQFSHMHKEEQE